MSSLEIKTSTNIYHVYVDVKLRHKLPSFLEKEYSNVLIITDSHVEKLFLDDVIHSFGTTTKVSYAVVPAGESSKSIENYFNLMTSAIENGLDRHSLIVALGGGMVGDLAGFVAATYMRGIDYVQVPTTILAHDSSVGGKVAINHPEGKNLIGNFYPPQAVVYDVETLNSLPEKEVRSGYAEIVKHGLISDEAFFNQVMEQNILSTFNPQILKKHLIKGISVKANIVETDEKEGNIRKYLNLGHTLGHALEAELGYGKITHGEAVALGMLFALQVSEKVYGVTLPYDTLYNWLSKNNYPLHLSRVDKYVLLNRMKKDKKSRDLKVQMVLLKAIGQSTIEQLDDEQLIQFLENFFRELVKG